MRKLRKRDVYEVMKHWIMSIKNHSTGIVHATALPCKQPKFIAHELEKYFSLVGCPSIFHTDSGNKFTAKSILKFLKNNNPSIVTVTVCP